MAISAPDIKKLWGLAAGRCSAPGCDEECIRFLSQTDPTVIGEMAHVIAQSATGPRGDGTGGDDTYENLILLCPTHHREIDKAPEGVFPAEVLYAWKEKHEKQVASLFEGRTFEKLADLARHVKRLLIQNKKIWMQFGPESLTAKNNPVSSAYEIWVLRKLDTIVPNNREIINIVEANANLFSLAEYEACCQFIEHARGFERNCYIRTEDVPKFPSSFEEVIDEHV